MNLCDLWELMRANCILYFDRLSRRVCLELHSISCIMIRGHVIRIRVLMIVYAMCNRIFSLKKKKQHKTQWLANIILTVDWRALAWMMMYKVWTMKWDRSGYISRFVSIKQVIICGKYRNTQSKLKYIRVCVFYVRIFNIFYVKTKHNRSIDNQ